MAKEALTIFKETSIPYIGANAFSEATFHNFELVSMISRTSKLESAWPFATLMAAKEMLKVGYQLGQGLDAVGHGKASLIELPDNKGRFGLGYDPCDEELFQVSKVKKGKCIGQGMSIPYIKVTFLALAKVIRLEVVQDSYVDDLTSTIRPYVPGEIVGHWTVKPYFVVVLAK